MKQEQGEAREKEKTGEVVALKEGQRTKRHPIAEKINHRKRDGDEFEKNLRKGRKIR